ncbi:diaminopimelate epimerase [Mesobacillus selenatarsenatis]|uniref:Diaminopimelate epimerase n=1 Tax=Mesobacillus selenatarsenatis (strain DSM 18680 / JCM 14380 / FERM P-15431 / SF-1) TaxID=1321606 RepID=A0A0A8XCH3_MESS1|nr:diaminopimelate epimerase [Mesobacillus selenatarsenatis]GAM16727.1 diaminopimelate epimerase [Mesobacillus selenatarsenatis SF-1]
MKIDLIKCHGSNNDFLLIDETDRNYKFDDFKRRDLALALCDRESSLGADGILFIRPSRVADAQYRIFNSDGTEASMCGNGLRCAGRYVCEKLGVVEAVIETMKANLRVKKHEEIFIDIPTYQVEISPVTFDLKDLPLNLDQETLIQEEIPQLAEELTFTALSVPNPHLTAVVSKEQLESDLQTRLSEKVNNPNDLFPDGVNVSFIRLLEKGSIYVRTYERGVGYTNACGTAMSASTLVTCLMGENEFDQPINVYNNGGMVQCAVHKEDETYTIDLIGNATFVYSAQIEVDFTKEGILAEILEQEDFNEDTLYSRLQEHAKKYLNQF